MAGFKKAGSLGDAPKDRTAPPVTPSETTAAPSAPPVTPASGLSGTIFGARKFSAPAMRGAAPTGTASLIIVGKPNDTVKVRTLSGGMTLGRKSDGSDTDIQLESKIVSRKHGMFTTDAAGFCYTDMGSMNGTYINEHLLMRSSDTDTSAAIRLHDGDIIRIDRRELNRPHAEAITMIFSENYDKDSEWRSYPIEGSFSVKIGMGADRRAAVNSAGADAAEIFRRDGRIYINNPSAFNTVLINNNPIRGEAELFERTVIKIFDTLIFVLDGKLVYNARVVKEKGLIVDLRETAVMERGHKKSLLRDVHIEINKGDFVLILGGSGAGKSTLVNSILGKYEISGSVNVVGGGMNSIGYVPQTLAIRKNERLIDVVSDTALLRMNGYMSDSDRQRFVMETLASFGLAEKAKMQIKNLSGGEQRRASIANEVVTNPDIFFLDEPDSGLDPRSGMELMIHLQRLAAMGKIVMLISHNYASYPNPEEIYGKVIVLAKSDAEMVGQLAFLGTVPEALEFFEVPALRDITKLINPRSENGDGRADEFIAKFRRLSR